LRINSIFLSRSEIAPEREATKNKAILTGSVTFGHGHDLSDLRDYCCFHCASVAELVDRRVEQRVAREQGVRRMSEGACNAGLHRAVSQNSSGLLSGVYGRDVSEDALMLIVGGIVGELLPGKLEIARTVEIVFVRRAESDLLFDDQRVWGQVVSWVEGAVSSLFRTNISAQIEVVRLTG
jgi:hypothetical protein